MRLRLCNKFPLNYARLEEGDCENYFGLMRQDQTHADVMRVTAEL